MRVALDATPLLGTRTGIGRYVEHLLVGLARLAATGEHDLDLVATAFSVRGRGALPAAVPPDVTVRARPAPANLLQLLWSRLDVPPAELACGKVDVLHGTNMVLPPTRRARGLLTVHDLAYLRMPAVVDDATLRLRRLVPRGLARAAVVLTPSRATAADLEEAYSVDPDRVVVTPLGVEPAWLTAQPPTEGERAALGLPRDYLLAVGTLEPRKDLATLLRAVALLPADAPPLVLVGPPGWGPALDRAGLAPGRVVEAGYLSQQQLRPVVAGAACLAFSSLLEGFGLPPLEALGAGTPVVASDLPVTREVLGPHAVFAPAGDAEGFAAALAEVLAGRTPTVAAERRAWAAGSTWERTARLTLAAYRRADG